MKHEKKQTHWLIAFGDYRYEGLVEMFKGFEKALDYFNQKVKEISWYDGGHYKDDTDLIYGVILVCLQNYINGCCSDFIEIQPDGFRKKYEYYSENSIIIANGTSQIRLIVELANYFKHRDERGDLHNNTKKCFENLDLLKYSRNEENCLYDDLISEGINILCPNNYNINQLLPIVKTWRDKNIERL